MLSMKICQKCWQSLNKTYWPSEKKSESRWNCSLWVTRFEYDPMNLSTRSKPPKDCPYALEHQLETQKC